MVPYFSKNGLILAEISEEDAEGIYGFASHEQVAKTTLWEAHRTIAETERYIRTTRNRISLQSGQFFVAWTVFEKDSGQVIGSISLTELAAHRAQIGFTFHFEHWKSRKPLEALQIVLEWMFVNLPQFERVQARCLPQTAMSATLLSGVGMKFEGINRSIARVNHEFVDLSCYAMTRTDWRQMTKEDGKWQVETTNSPEVV